MRKQIGKYATFFFVFIIPSSITPVHINPDALTAFKPIIKYHIDNAINRFTDAP